MDRLIVIEDIQWLLLALFVNLSWFMVMLYLDMRKLAKSRATNVEPGYVNKRLTHLIQHLKVTNILKAPTKRRSK